MNSKLLIIALCSMVVFLQGCNTMKGAKDGFKKDWNELNAADGWVKENLW